MNEDWFPRLVNIKTKLEFPTALKDDAKTIENLRKWNEYLAEVKKKLKVQVLAQSDRTCEFLQEQRFGLFMEKNVSMAEGFGAYHHQLEGAKGAPLSNQAYGAVGVYCYYNRLSAYLDVFSYLGEDKKKSMAKVKAKCLTAANGSSLFHASQLQELSRFTVTADEVVATPQWLPLKVDAPLRPPGGSPMASEQSLNRLEPEEEEKEPGPQPHNPYCGATVPLAQETVPETPQNNTTEPSGAQAQALTGNAQRVIQRICDILSGLVPPLFLQISNSTTEEAALKKKATLDMGQALDESLAKEPTVAHKNMEGLIQSIVQGQLKNDQKRKKNEIVKEALKEARKNLREEKRAKKPSATNSVMAKRKKSNPKALRAPLSLRNMRKRQYSNDPDGDYARWQYWQQKPYWNQGPRHTPTNSRYYPPGQGSFKGHGQDRGR
jgi:hypothetical protein